MKRVGLHCWEDRWQVDSASNSLALAMGWEDGKALAILFLY